MRKITISLISFLYLSHQNIRAMAAIADPEDSWNTATKILWEAVKNNESDLVIRAITDDADVNVKSRMGFTALMIAADNEDIKTIKILIENQADVNTQDNYGWTALLYAVYKGFTEIVDTLTKNKANVNTANVYNMTALLFAAKFGYAEIVDILIKNNADINAKDNHFNNTALIYAAENGHTEIVRILVKNNVNINAKNYYGHTALIDAADHEYTEIVDILIKNNADINIKYRSGWINNATVLMAAARHKNREAVRMLLAKGANPDEQNSNAQSARQINPKLIDEAIKANRIKIEAIDTQLTHISLLLSKLHNNHTGSASNAVLNNIFKLNDGNIPHNWPTNEEFERIQPIKQLPFAETDL